MEPREVEMAGHMKRKRLPCGTLERCKLQHDTCNFHRRRGAQSSPYYSHADVQMSSFVRTLSSPSSPLHRLRLAVFVVKLVIYLPEWKSVVDDDDVVRRADQKPG